MSVILFAVSLAAAAQPEVKQFQGEWRGICADGKEFVVLKLDARDSGIGGTISIANMQGADGQCESVVDAPSPEHAMNIVSAEMHQVVLAFKTDKGARFEMNLSGNEGARLKFVGTPVANFPWELQRGR